jgi:hypothetical protein
MIIDFFLEVKNCKLNLVLVSHIGGTLISNLVWFLDLKTLVLIKVQFKNLNHFLGKFLKILKL